MPKAILPQDIARDFTEDPAYKKDLVYCIDHDSFYIWNDPYYKLYTQREFTREVYKFIISKYGTQKITKGFTMDIVQQINWLTIRSVNDLNNNYIAFKDSFLNLTTFAFGPIDKQKVINYYQPYEKGELDMEIPNFLEFIKSSLVKEGTRDTDEELVTLCQEMFGYFLMKSIKGSKAFFFVGDGSNGKSVMANLIQDIIGQPYCSAMSIRTLTTDKFSTHNLIGKKLNISNEEESKWMESDKFKALITGERITGERKFGDPFEFIPITKYLFATNELPTFDKMNYGLKRRIVIIPFHRKFSNKEQDKDLPEKLRNEIPGIINWAIKGAKRLIKNNYNFGEAGSSDFAMDEFEDEISSALRFIREQYLINDRAWIHKDELYDHYIGWCNKNNKKPKNAYAFAKDIGRNVRGLQNIQQTTLDGRARGRNLILRTVKDTIPDDLFKDKPNAVGSEDEPSGESGPGQTSL